MPNAYLQAARLRTLPLSISGIVVGAQLAITALNRIGDENLYLFTSPIFWLAILTTVGFQVVSNFANDYGDGVKGTDKNRTGEARMVASGKISPKQMKSAMIFTAALTLVCAVLLIYIALGSKNFLYSIVFFALGVASIVAAIFYTVGKSAYGYSGYGDIFVFLFFGLLSVMGTYFLFTKQIDWHIVFPAIAIGFLSTAVLNLNNLRDRHEDKLNKKNTLVVKMGLEKAKTYHTLLIVLACVSALIYVLLNYKTPFQFLFLVAFIPLLKNVVTVRQHKIPAVLDSELKKVALSTFLFAILFSVGHSFVYL